MATLASFARQARLVAGPAVRACSKSAGGACRAPHRQTAWPLTTMSTSAEAARSSRVAVAQMTSTGSQEDSFRVCSRLAEDAAQANAGMLFLPECCSFIGESAEETVRHATPLDGPVLGCFRDLAARLGIWLSLGGFHETSPGLARLYNTHVIIDSTGRIAARYRKIHLFDVDVKGGPILMESRSTAPGSEVVDCETPAGRLGLMTCYDIRFPWLSDALRERGAQILTYPSAFTVKTGEAHWELLLRARAVETQCYVIAAAQAGQHNSKRQSYGHAMVVDPWGEVVAKLDNPHATGIAVTELDMGHVNEIRTNMPIWEHRTAARRLCCAAD